MENETKGKVIMGVLKLLILTPIGFYLFFNVLKSINATELIWFLFWMYVPIMVICAIISTIIGGK